MAYKYSKGKTYQGDIYNEDDTQRNTYLDWSEDAIGFVAGGEDCLIISGSGAISSSLNVSASAFYGDGSNLENITATASPAGSDGQIQYNNGGSTGGAASLYWHDDSNRLGIGTSNPSRQLDIEGADNALIQFNATNYRAYSMGSDAYGFTIFDDSTGGTPGYRFVISDQADALGYVGIGAGASIAGSNHPDALLHLSSSDDGQIFRADTTDGTTVLFATGSNRVGIGTSEPNARLSVSGSEFDGLAIEVADNHTTYFQISGSEQGSVTAFGFTADKAAQDNSDVSFFVSGTVGGKGDYGVTVISGDLQVSGNIYNTLGDGENTHLSPYLAQQILDPSSYALFTITNNQTTLYKVDWDTGDTSCTDPHVTFTAPPSGKVLVDVHAYIDDTSTSGGGPYVYLALSTSTAASISSTDGTIVGSEKVVWRPDEEDDGVKNVTFYASGLTPGTSYTWNLFARRWNDGDNNRIICGAQYPATIMQVRPVMDNADIYSS